MEILQGVWKQHLRPRTVVGYGVKIVLPSPPYYVTRSPGKYPDSLIKSTICHFVTSVRSENPEVQAQSTNRDENTIHRVVLPFKDQKSADAVKSNYQI